MMYSTTMDPPSKTNKHAHELFEFINETLQTNQTETQVLLEQAQDNKLTFLLKQRAIQLKPSRRFHCLCNELLQSVILPSLTSRPLTELRQIIDCPINMYKTASDPT